MLKPNTPRQVAWPNALVALLAVTGAMLGFVQTDSLVYAMFQHGGSAFLLMYGSCLLLVGVPMAMAWLLLGRRAHAPALAVVEAAQASKLNRRWRWLGLFWQLLAFLLLILILRWVGQVSGGLLSHHVGHAEWLSSVLGFLVVVWLAGAVSPDWQGRINAWLMLLLLALTAFLLVQAGREHTLGSSWQELFSFRPELLGWASLVQALKQVLGVASIGGAALWLYGHYLPQRPASLVVWSSTLLLVETLVALLVGLAGFALASGLPPSSGSGHFLYRLMAPIAALMAASALGEAVTVRLTTQYLKRPLALFVVLLAAGLLAAVNLSTGWLSGLSDLVWQWLLPLAVLLLAVFVGWMMKETQVRKGMAIKSFPVYLATRALLRLLVPLVMLALLGHAGGLW
jgi:NSS family neurotransmitter:Na+ symporter